MLKRELAITLRARLTWLQASLSALLVGHGFVLAMDLYSAGSRSVHASTLMAREFDPLLGIVRPTLGGLNLSLSLLGPLVAARVLSVEKERRTFYALLLQTAAPARLLGGMFIAAAAGLALQLLAPLGLLGLWSVLGGHLAWPETLVPLLGYVFYLMLIASLSLMAAAWTATLAQAVTLALLLAVVSWAIDAAEGFAALAWLARALDWSVSTQLAPFEHAIVSLGACVWLLLLSAAALTAAWIGVRADLSLGQRGLALAGVIVAAAVGCTWSAQLQRAFDLTENARASLPPAVIRELRGLPQPLRIDVWLDRDDARRQQLEADALSKLRLARHDLIIRTPLDDRSAPGESDHEEGYGRIVVQVGQQTRETYSTSRRELVTLMFEASGRPIPDFSQHEYPGYPLIVEGGKRSVVVAWAYFVMPLLLLVTGWLCTRSTRRTT